MGKRRGFTFVEVIIGLLLVSFALAILASSYLQTTRTIGQGRRINSETFDLRNEMEEQIATGNHEMMRYNEYWDDTKGTWKGGTPPTPEPKKPKELYVCCGLKVKGYPVEAEDKGRTVHSFIARKYREIRVPVVGNVKLNVTGEEVGGVVFKYQQDAASGSLSGSYDKIENSDIFYHAQHKWYVSNRYILGATGNILANAASYGGERTPQFSEDYTRLEANASALGISPSDVTYQDAVVRYSVTPLSTNKYVGNEIEGNKAVYFIGLPLQGSMANLKAHYHADVVSGFSGEDWQDVRAYTKQTGAFSENPLALKPEQMEQGSLGNYALFGKDSSGSFSLEDMTMFFRIKNLETDKRVSLMQSKEPELTEANKGKIQFDLSLENQQLVLYTREVVEKPKPEKGVQFAETKKTVLIPDMKTGGSYRQGYEGDAREGFNVLSIRFDKGSLTKINQFVVDHPGNTPPVHTVAAIAVPNTVRNLAGSDIQIAADKDFDEEELEGKMGISDIVVYPKDLPEGFEKQVGKYLVHRYLIETPN